MAARGEYPYARPIPTRWADADFYGHVNNVQFYAYLDTVINAYLVEEAGLDPSGGAVIGLCAESHCTFHRALHFPEVVDARLRVAHLGRSSVRYEVGLFGEGEDEPAAEGWFVHVFVGRDDRRPAEVPAAMRAALERLQPA